jgi:hypothetical protein
MLQNNKLCYLPELHVTVLYTDQTKKQKERRWEITTPVKIQNMSSYTHTKSYGLCKFIEHHHGETKQFIDE